MARVHRLVLSVADRPNSPGINAQPGQRLAQSQRAAFAEGAVVFPGAALVAVALDEQSGSGIGVERPGHRGHIRLLALLNHGAVKFEMHGVGSEFLAINICAGDISPVGGSADTTANV